MSLIQHLACGKTVGNRYHLDVKIHEGRWGDVYRATDTIDDRPVAIRLFPAAEGGPADFDRFSAHARVLSGLSTPIISAPIDHGLEEDTPFLVYRWARGQNLQDKVAELGALSRKQTLDVLLKVLEGLDRAHESRMTHGLIRPVKIKVADLDGPNPFVKVVDFQIWRFFEWSTGKDAFDESNLSRRIVRYTAPEVLNEHRVKPTTDIYSLGLVVIELLTGKPAFDDNHRVALIANQMSEEPAELSARADAGDGFRDFLGQMIAKDQTDRFFTAGKALKKLNENYDTFLSEPAANKKAPPPEAAPEKEEAPPAPDLEPSQGLAEPSGILKKKRKPSKSKPKSDSLSTSALPTDDDLDQDLPLGGGDSDDFLAAPDSDLFDNDANFGDFYERSSMDASDFGDDDEEPLLIGTPEPSDKPPSTPASREVLPAMAEEDPEALAADIPDGKIPEASDRSDSAVITDSSIPVSPTGQVSPHAATGRSNKKADNSSNSNTVIAVVLFTLAVIAFYFVVLHSSDEPDEPVGGEEEIAQQDLIDERPDPGVMHTIRVNTNPPAQRIMIPGRDRRMMSPLEVQIGENEFPIQIRARLNAEVFEDRLIEGPTEEEIFFDFSEDL